MPDLNPMAAPFAHNLRVRVCGICLQQDKVLLVRHGKTINNSCFWAPPGGGLSYGESVQECLRREFKEETGLAVQVQRFLFVNEFLEEPLHAVELFFEVQPVAGALQPGLDPELAPGAQLIEGVEWLTVQQLRDIPLHDKHRVLHHLLSPDDLLGLPHNFRG